MAQGYGYQPADVLNPVPNADAGAINVRVNVADAGAGMDKVAQAGRETESVADKIQRQEDMTAALMEKNESAAKSNQAWLDFQPKMTGNIQQDQAAWEAISAKIGQESLGRLATPAAQQAFTKEYDSLHKTSIIQVQNQSMKNLLAKDDTASSGLFVNALKGAYAIVKAGGADYVAHVERLFQGYADYINASPLRSQAEKDSRLQAARQHFYMELAKYQAETTPGAFSRDWRDGVWTKHLSPEAVVQLQPFAEKAKVDAAGVALTFEIRRPNGTLDYAAGVRLARDPKWQEAHGLTFEQGMTLAAKAEGQDSFEFGQIQKKRALAADSAGADFFKSVNAEDWASAQKKLDVYTAGGSLSLGQLEGMRAIIKNGKSHWDTDESVKQGIFAAAMTDQPYAKTGQPLTVMDIQAAVRPGGLSVDQGVEATRLLNSIPTPDRVAFQSASEMVKREGPAVHDQFMDALRATVKKEGLQGDDIKRRANELWAAPVAWYNPTTWGNVQPYEQIYKDTFGPGTLKTTPRAGTPLNMGASQPNQPQKVIRYDINGNRLN